MRGVRVGRERERQEWFVREGRESECCERVRGVRVGRKSKGLIGARKWGVKEGRESEGCERVGERARGLREGREWAVREGERVRVVTKLLCKSGALERGESKAREGV